MVLVLGWDKKEGFWVLAGCFLSTWQGASNSVVFLFEYDNKIRRQDGLFPTYSLTYIPGIIHLFYKDFN